MKRKGFTLVEIMVVVAIIALLSAIAIPNLLRARSTANEAAAQAGLSILSTAIETYATVNNGQYAPANSTVNDTYLITSVPPYLSKAYCTQTVGGYNYTCNIGLLAYSITTTPDKCGTTGSRNFNITTGGVLTAGACQ